MNDGFPGITTHRPACIACRDNGIRKPAVYLMPKANDDWVYSWVPACPDHAKGWWDPEADDPLALTYCYVLFETSNPE